MLAGKSRMYFTFALALKQAKRNLKKKTPEGASFYEYDGRRLGQPAGGAELVNPWTHKSS